MKTTYQFEWNTNDPSPGIYHVLLHYGEHIVKMGVRLGR